MARMVRIGRGREAVLPAIEAGTRVILVGIQGGTVKLLFEDPAGGKVECGKAGRPSPLAALVGRRRSRIASRGGKESLRRLAGGG